MSTWAFMVSRYVTLPSNQMSSNSDNSSSDPSNPSKSFSGEVGCVSKLSRVVRGTEAEAACSAWLLDKGMRGKEGWTKMTRYSLISLQGRILGEQNEQPGTTRCLDMRKRSTTNCGQVHAH